MKKIYISLILIIIIVLGISSTSFAAHFYDTIGTKYESPTEILYTLGIVDGTSENVFSAGRPVTRAEMAKLILSVYGLDDNDVKMSIGTNNFKDVKKSDWYYGYVNVAADIKMINGYSDGTFRPNDEVTYSEAATMIIRALGYTDLVAKPGEAWDAPYIRKMNEIRLSKNVGYFKNNDAATRGNVAIMIWNMLNAECYVVVKDKTNVGLIKETTPKKVINRYYPDYAIIDEDILEGIIIYKDIIDDKEEIEYYIKTKEISMVKTPEPIPLKRIGVKITGIYNIEENEAIGINYIYDTDFDEGTVAELEDIYELTDNRKYTYTLGRSKNYAYIYFDENEKISRITYLGSNENILVKETKIEKEKIKDGDEEKYGLEHITINDQKVIPTSEILINKDGEILSWSDVKANGVLSSLDDGIYVYNDKIIKGELQKVQIKNSELCLTIDGELFVCDTDATYKLYGSETTKKALKSELDAYVGKKVEAIASYSNEIMEITLEENYENAKESVRYGVVVNKLPNEKDTTRQTIKIATADGQRILNVKKEIFNKELVPGTIIHFELTRSNIDFMETFVEDLKTAGGIVDMNLESKEYNGDTLGKYGLSENTVIYLIEKQYQVNSDKSIKDYHMSIEDNRKILEDLKEYDVHVVHDENDNAISIFIEKELNKYKYKYGRVLEIIQETVENDKSETQNVLKIRVSPFNNAIDSYIISGNVTCEPGDLISYETDGEELTIKERYNAKVLGDKRDYIVENVKNNTVYLKNGDEIDITKNEFEIEGKQYLFDKYIVVYARVTKTSGEWKFYSTAIMEPEDLKIKAGDRIAMDEIEDLFVVYRGYTD